MIGAIDTEMRAALLKIEAALPEDGRQALGILLAASAAKAIDADVSDAKAVDGLITSLQLIREKMNQTRVN